MIVLQRIERKMAIASLILGFKANAGAVDFKVIEARIVGQEKKQRYETG
jgi:hypothetical protein